MPISRGRAAAALRSQLASCKTLAFQSFTTFCQSSRTTGPADRLRIELASPRTSPRSLGQPRRLWPHLPKDPKDHKDHKDHVLQLFTHGEGGSPRPAAAEATVVSNADAGGTF